MKILLLICLSFCCWVACESKYKPSESNFSTINSTYKPKQFPIDTTKKLQKLTLWDLFALYQNNRWNIESWENPTLLCTLYNKANKENQLIIHSKQYKYFQASYVCYPVQLGSAKDNFIIYPAKQGLLLKDFTNNKHYYIFAQEFGQVKDFYYYIDFLDKYYQTQQRIIIPLEYGISYLHKPSSKNAMSYMFTEVIYNPSTQMYLYELATMIKDTITDYTTIKQIEQLAKKYSKIKQKDTIKCRYLSDDYDLPIWCLEGNSGYESSFVWTFTKKDKQVSPFATDSLSK